MTTWMSIDNGINNPCVVIPWISDGSSGTVFEGALVCANDDVIYEQILISIVCEDLLCFLQMRRFRTDSVKKISMSLK